MTKEIIEYIQENQLDSNKRHREYAYRRFYLANLLRKEGLSFQNIADIFHRTHATILHSINVHEHFMKSKDTIYLFHIQKELDIFEPVQEEKRDIYDDILRVNNTTDLAIIKRRIADNEYYWLS